MSDKPDRAAWINGADARCINPPRRPRRSYRVVLLGPPGVGKGTQAELLSCSLGACHLSTGDIFRAAKTQCSCELTPSMAVALEYMRKGELVPDATVLAVVRERAKCLHCYGGFLLDGFPRTVPQAEALDALLAKRPLDAVISYELPIECIISRLSGRRTCSKCKAVFHSESRPPKQEGRCDHCGGNLFQRDDDQPEAIRVRMGAYARSTTPLIDFYGRQGILVAVSAEGSPDEIHCRTLNELEKLVGSLKTPQSLLENPSVSADRIDMIVPLT